MTLRAAAGFFPAILLLGLVSAPFKSSSAQLPAGTKIDLSTVPGVTIQNEDYAKVRRHFPAKLLKKGLLPNKFVPRLAA